MRKLLKTFWRCPILKKKKVLGVIAYNSCRINGETMEIMTDFIFLGSKIIADGDCSYENKRCLLLGRKSMTNLDNILKSRDITLLPKAYLITEKAMAPHYSTLAWKIPWIEESGRLQSKGSQRVRHDWVTSLSLFTFMRWRRKWQPTPVFLPGESQGCGSLVGCCLSGRTESDTTEVT